MNGLILVLAMVGQQDCGPQGCPAPQAVRSTAWENQAVRVKAYSGPSIGIGSGVIVAVDTSSALVLTNRHVIAGSQKVVVLHLGRTYAANVVRVSDDPQTDVAALEIAAPAGAKGVNLAKERPVVARSYGYDGETGTFHVHTGTLIGSYQGAVYSFSPHEGDSGSGLFNDRGELAGLVWGGSPSVGAATVSTARLREFLAHPTCFRFFQRRPRQINVQVTMPTNPVVPVPPPVDPTPVTPASPTPVPPGTGNPVVVQNPPFDPTAILNRLTALENQPIVMAVKQPNGTLSPPRTFAPQVDPKTGARAIGVTLDLNPPAIPTPANP